MKIISSLEQLLEPSADVAKKFSQEEVVGVVSAQQSARVMRRMNVTTAAIGEAEDAEQDLSDVRETLNEIAVDGRVSMEAYVLSQLVVKSSTGLSQLKPQSLGPSLESYAGGEVTVGLEDIGDSIDSIRRAISETFWGWIDDNIRSLTVISVQCMAARKHIRTVRDRVLAMSDFRTDKVPLSGIATLKGGKPPTDMARDGKASMQMLVALNGPWHEATAEALRKNARNVMLLDGTSDGFVKTFEHLVRNWAVAPVNGDAVNATVLANAPLFVDKGSHYRGVDPTLREFDRKVHSRMLGTLHDWRKNRYEESREQIHIYPGINRRDALMLLDEAEKALDSIRHAAVLQQKALVAMRSPTLIGATVAMGAAAAAGLTVIEAVAIQALGVIASKGVYALTSTAPVGKFRGHTRVPEHSRMVRLALRSQERQLRSARVDVAIVTFNLTRALATYVLTAARLAQAKSA